MVKHSSTLKEEVSEWRKVLRKITERLDKPQRLDRNYTRGRYGVAFDPLPSGNCKKHRVYDKKGKYLYTINDPFCEVCFPPARRSAR